MVTSCWTGVSSDSVDVVDSVASSRLIDEDEVVVFSFNVV